MYTEGLPPLPDRNAPFVAPPLSRAIMNLTTKVDSLSFHPSGQILAVGSSEVSRRLVLLRAKLTFALLCTFLDQKNDQLRLVHLPSLTVFSNWPTESTPIRKLQCCEFSPGGGYFAIGSSTGKVLLYRVQHFANC
jgi:U3 small nucleolar RNA-associated protein 18